MEGDSLSDRVFNLLVDRAVPDDDTLSQANNHRLRIYDGDQCIDRGRVDIATKDIEEYLRNREPSTSLYEEEPRPVHIQADENTREGYDPIYKVVIDTPRAVTMRANHAGMSCSYIPRDRRLDDTLAELSGKIGKPRHPDDLRSLAVSVMGRHRDISDTKHHTQCVYRTTFAYLLLADEQSRLLEVSAKDVAQGHLIDFHNDAHHYLIDPRVPQVQSFHQPGLIERMTPGKARAEVAVQPFRIDVAY